jgi:hypothetical protein
MILLPTKQNFAASSGLFNIGHMENIYHSMMDEMFIKLGREAIVHFPPLIQQDTATSSVPQAQQYNPFFGRAPLPNPTARNPGVKVTHRDIPYKVQSRITIKGAKDEHGIGDLKDNQIALTFPIEALQDVQNCISVSFEGRRYQVDEDRPFGFSIRRYFIAILSQLNEIDTNTTGTNG